MTTNERPDNIIHNCGGRGTNPRCKAAAKQGRYVHIIPRWSADTESVVLPDYHFFTETAAREVLADARATAPLVTCDDDLYEYRAQGIAHKLPVGWIDPTARR